jgi:hypothetical protein
MIITSLRYGNNAFLRDGPKVNLFKTAHRAILLCLDFLAGSRAGRRVWLLNSILRGVRQRGLMVLDPNQIPRIDPPAARLASEKMFGLMNAPTIGALAEHGPARSRFGDWHDRRSGWDH